MLNGGDLFSPCAIDIDAREVILKADAAAGGFVEIGSERFAAAPWVSGSGMPYTTVALTKADIARLRRAHVLLALMAETWNGRAAGGAEAIPKSLAAGVESAIVGGPARSAIFDLTPPPGRITSDHFRSRDNKGGGVASYPGPLAAST